jgi:hypothetical protein
MVVVGLVGVVMVAVPGLPAWADQVPAPTAAIVAVPPGSVVQVTVWAGPALGPAVTITAAVSVHDPFAHLKL